MISARDRQYQAWSVLMAEAQAGNAASYDRLLHEIVPFLRAILRAKAPPDQIEDVLQEVLITLHRVRHTYDPGRPFVPWLAAITHRRAIDARRRVYRRRAIEVPDDPAYETIFDPQANNAEQALELADHASWLRQAIDALPRQQKAALELVKLRELSIAEAAAASGQTPGAVKVNVHRGLLALRRLLAGSA